MLAQNSRAYFSERSALCLSQGSRMPEVRKIHTHGHKGASPPLRRRRGHSAARDGGNARQGRLCCRQDNSQGCRGSRSPRSVGPFPLLHSGQWAVAYV